jgi:hypothetical protein
MLERPRDVRGAKKLLFIWPFLDRCQTRSQSVSWSTEGFDDFDGMTMIEMTMAFLA